MILHLDMDAFFAAVEQLDDPSLRGKPVIVGGGERGVVSTASYEARVFGVHSAMPMTTARRLCPDGIFIHGNFRRYSEISHKIMACLRGFSPVVQVASIDEAYLDIGGLQRLMGAPLNIAQAIKKAVRECTAGLTCSIGIAPIKFLAKICSDINKPDGICIVEEAEMDAFLLSLPVHKLPGVGKIMSERLASFGIVSVAQLRQLSRSFMLQSFGKWGGVLLDRSWGIDPAVVHENRPAQSEGRECTFVRDVFDRETLVRALAAHAERVGEALRRNGFAGRTVTLKVKFADFRLITRSRTLKSRTDSNGNILSVACSLLADVPVHQGVRLIGISVSGFEARVEQLALPLHYPSRDNMEHDMARARLERAVDSLRQRFGPNIISRGIVADTSSS